MNEEQLLKKLIKKKIQVKEVFPKQKKRKQLNIQISKTKKNYIANIYLKEEDEEKKKKTKSSSSSATYVKSDKTQNATTKKHSSSSFTSFSGGVGGVSYNSNSYKNFSSVSLKKSFDTKNSVVVKTNFIMTGRRQSNGTRATKQTIISHANSSLSYIDNHGSKDLEESESLSNLYNEVGERETKEDIKEFKKELDIQAFRRIIISPEENLSREELKELTLKTMQDFEEKTGKSLTFRFAIHTDTEHNHVHIVVVGSNKDINLKKEQINTLKSISYENLKELSQDLTKDRDIQQEKTQEVSL